MARVLSVLGALALLGGAAFAFLAAGLVNHLQPPPPERGAAEKCQDNR